jgi:hypothetical protein
LAGTRCEIDPEIYLQQHWRRRFPSIQLMSSKLDETYSVTVGPSLFGRGATLRIFSILSNPGDVPVSSTDVVIPSNQHAFQETSQLVHEYNRCSLLLVLDESTVKKDRLCGLVVRVPGYRPSGPEFDCRC